MKGTNERLMAVSEPAEMLNPMHFSMFSEEHSLDVSHEPDNREFKGEELEKLKEEMNLVADEQHTEAARKRRLAQILRKISDLLQEEIEPPQSSQDMSKGEDNDGRLSNEKYQAIINLQTAKVLEFEAEQLESKSQQRRKFVKEAVFDSSGFPICNILKIGPLEFVSTSDEIRHRLDHTVTGRLTGTSFTIFQKKKPKLVYELSSIFLPIFNVADTGDTCWGFLYHGSNQIFCTANRESRNSWMNAVSEAWFCENEGLQGSLPSIQDIEPDHMNSFQHNLETPKKSPKKKKLTTDIYVGLTEQNVPNVTVNGEPIEVS